MTAGLLVYVTAGGGVQAVPLRPSATPAEGPPVTVANNVAITGTAVAQFAVAPNGNVAYIPEEPASLVFVDRQRRQPARHPERRNFHHPLFSPDGRRLSLDFSSVEGRNVWILGLDQGTLSRATFDRDGHDATWTPDGRFLTYIAPVNRPGGVTLCCCVSAPAAPRRPTRCWPPRPGVYRRLAAGRQRVGDDCGQPPAGSRRARTRRRPARARRRHHPERRPGSARAAGGEPVQRAVRRRFARRPLDLLRVGPVRPGRGVRAGSGGRAGPGAGVADGGNEPIWSPDGRELYYRETQRGRAVSRRGRHRDHAGARGDPPEAALPDRRHRRHRPHANYDISPDGKTFVMVRRSPSARIVVMQNLPALVRRMQGRQ